ncbi:MAG TPA: NAD(P)-dependent oxidoreductase [Gaiellaceae bacterium]
MPESPAFAPPSDRFRVGITRDVEGTDGRPVYDLSALDEAGVEWEWLRGDGELTPADVAPFDAIVLFHPRVTSATLAGVDRLALVARLGVGVDNIDVDACTRARVLVTVTPDSVRRPMAAGAMAFVLALAHRLPEMDRHVRAGRWERFAHVGTGLDGRTLGIVGLGNVGRELATLAKPFGLHVVAADPFVADGPEGVELCALDDLLGRADFVVVTCPLTEETWHLVGAPQLARMKPTAYIVNIARGPIVDGEALAEALQAGVIAGAALDVFDPEPPSPDDPLLALDNVILAPHAIGLTDELFRLGGRSAARAVLAVRDGRLPEFPLNPEAAR